MNEPQSDESARVEFTIHGPLLKIMRVRRERMQAMLGVEIGLADAVAAALSEHILGCGKK